MSLYKMPIIKDKTYSLVYYVSENNAMVIFTSNTIAYLLNGKIENLNDEGVIKSILRHDNDDESMLYASDLLLQWKKEMEITNHKVILINCPYNI